MDCPWQEWSLPILGLTAASIVAGVASFGVLEVSQQLLGQNGLLIQLLQLCLAGLVGLCIFGAIAAWMKLPEVNVFVSRLRQRVLKK